MMMPLPHRNFMWTTPAWSQPGDTIEFQTECIDEIEEDDKMGHFFEVDLEYPTEYHNSHNDFPLLPENRNIDKSMLSTYQLKLAKDTGVNLKVSAKSRKLVCSLHDKSRYVLHGRLLKQALRLGMRLKKIHRVLSFDQSRWLASYIAENTRLRTENSDSEFDVFFYKLLNNSFYGKTVENIMKHKVFKVVTSGTEFHRLRRKLQYSQADVLSNNLAIVELEKANLVYDKPRYVGITVLNLAKLLMYNFHYQEVKRRFGKVKAQVSLLFTDTDSLMYSIEQKPDQKQYNPWKILSRSKEMVFHNFPPNSKYYCEKNIMVPGFFKSEFANKLILEFVGLNAKVYSIKFPRREDDKKTHKGVSKWYQQQRLQHKHYYRALFYNEMKTANTKHITSKSHKLYTIRRQKKCLSSFNDKQYYKHRTFPIAHGHYLLKHNDDGSGEQN